MTSPAQIRTVTGWRRPIIMETLDRAAHHDSPILERELQAGADRQAAREAEERLRAKGRK